jgi:Leucine-rich repeat (LRR) protein
MTWMIPGPELWQLTGLTMLTLDDCDITSLPAELGGLTSLKAE